MNIIKKLMFASAASKLVDSLRGLPHGPVITMVSSGALVCAQWLTNNGDLFGDDARPYVTLLLAVINGVYSLSALGASAPGGEKADSGRAIASQALLVTLQVLNAFAPIAPPYWQGMIADAIPVIQSMQATKWLREQAS